MEEEDDKFGSRVRSSLFVLVWFCLNVSMAIINKLIFAATDFKFPVFLSSIHLIVCGILANLVFYIPSPILTAEDREVSPEAKTRIRKFIIVFCFNIAFGNISIRIVDLAFSQMLRATTPVFILLLSYIILKTRVGYLTIASLIPVVVGVVIICYREWRFSFLDLLIILIGIIICAVKGVLTNLYLKKHGINPLVFLSYIAPWGSVVMILIGFVFGEATRFWGYLQEKSLGDVVDDLRLPIFSAIVAFLLNLFGFLANRSTSPLTTSVFGNIKQVLTIVLSIFIFSTQVSLLGYLGMMIAFSGMFAYTFSRFYEKKQAAAKTPVVQEEENAGPIVEEDLEMEEVEEEVEKAVEVEEKDVEEVTGENV